jgi:hypothetical protein
VGGTCGTNGGEEERRKARGKETARKTRDVGGLITLRWTFKR